MAKVRPQLPFAAPLFPWRLLQSPNVPGSKAGRHDRYPRTDVCGSPVFACGTEALRASPPVVPADNFIEAGNPGPNVVRSVRTQLALGSVSLTLAPLVLTTRLISIKQRLQPCPLHLRFPLVHDPGILGSTTSRSSRTTLVRLPSLVIFTVELVEDALGLGNQSKPFWFTNAGVRQAPCQHRCCVFLGDLPQTSIDYLQPRKDALIVHDRLRVAGRRAGRWPIIGRGKDRAGDGCVALDKGFCLPHRSKGVFGRF